MTIAPTLYYQGEKILDGDAACWWEDVTGRRRWFTIVIGIDCSRAKKQHTQYMMQRNKIKKPFNFQLFSKSQQCQWSSSPSLVSCLTQWQESSNFKRLIHSWSWQSVVKLFITSLLCEFLVFFHTFFVEFWENLKLKTIGELITSNSVYCSIDYDLIKDLFKLGHLWCLDLTWDRSKETRGWAWLVILDFGATINVMFSTMSGCRISDMHTCL